VEANKNPIVPVNGASVHMLNGQIVNCESYPLTNTPNNTILPAAQSPVEHDSPVVVHQTDRPTAASLRQQLPRVSFDITNNISEEDHGDEDEVTKDICSNGSSRGSSCQGSRCCCSSYACSFCSPRGSLGNTTGNMGSSASQLGSS
jgi:hypothetical protein